MRAGVDNLPSAETPADLESLIVHDPEEADDMSFTGVVGNSPTTNIASSVVVEEVEEEIPSGKGKKHIFFQRSDSTLCLGCPAPDPFQVKHKNEFKTSA